MPLLARIPRFSILALVLLASSASLARAETVFLIRDVHIVVLDPPRLIDGADVLVEGTKIAAIGPTGTLATPPGARLIEGGGFLMPGLIDSHVHIDETVDFPLWLGHGITTIRNMSGSPRYLEWRELIASGEIVGPRLVTSSPGISGTFYDSPLVFHAKTPQMAAAAARRFAAEGYDLIKTYRFDAATLEALHAAAQEAGIPIAGHLHDRDRDPFEILPRMKAVSHLDELLWFVYGSAIEDVDLEDFARRVRATGTTVETLLTSSFLMRRAVEAGESFIDGPEGRRTRDYAGPDDFEGFQKTIEGAAEWSEDDWARRRVPRRFLLDALHALVEAGVVILPGTDSQSSFAVAGVALLDELDIMAEAGLSPGRVLRAATIDAARFCGLDGKTGSIAVGLEADFVLLEENPLESLAALRTLRGMAARGRWYDSTALDRLKRPPYAE